jgi:hypothetical protein
MGFVLAIISQLLFSILWIINFPIVLFEHAKKKGFWKVTDTYWYQHAVAVDIFGNYAFRATWNLIFRTKEGYLFGKIGETISSALGKNQRDGTLTAVGKVMCFILDTLDKDHCIKSIQE